MFTDETDVPRAQEGDDKKTAEGMVADALASIEARSCASCRGPLVAGEDGKCRACSGKGE